MLNWRPLLKPQQLGKWGEDFAVTYLEQAGYEVVERNWRCQYGELDIVTRHKAAWVFVEIKTRRSSRFGIAQETVTVSQQRRLVDAARLYLAEHELSQVEWRIDVLAIDASAGRDHPHVELIENAVGNW